MPSNHAVLSASSSARWIACPPSALINARANDTTSVYAQQGTDAHSLSEHKLKDTLAMDTVDPRHTLKYLDEEMEDCTDAYVQYVQEQMSYLVNPRVLIEQRLDFSKWVDDGFGTGDCVLADDTNLIVIDLKYGLGVQVEAKDNTQLMCYGLGALALYPDVQNITLCIFQPRRHHISTHTLLKDELLMWADETLSPAAKLASQGKGDFSSGEHCRFCAIKATCRSRAEESLKMAVYEFEQPINLDTYEIEDILLKADGLIRWVSDVKDYALEQALAGHEWRNFCLGEARSIRKYTDEQVVADTVLALGKNPYSQKLLGITDMTKLLGKQQFNEHLSGLVYKPQGKEILVRR